MSDDIKGNILIVDDTPANLTLLMNMLKKRDYRVRAAKDGPTALRSVAANPPDLILLDIMMPDMDGYQVCEHLKADETTRDIPVIFISAMNETENIVHAFEVGGVDYVTKPFQFSEVMARVENHLTIVRQRKRIENLMMQERQHFEAINKMRDQFVYAATHDLKNPLSLITGYVYLLEADPKVVDDARMLEYTEGIRIGADRMQVLIKDMLDLIQLETSSGAFNILEYDLVEIVAKRLEMFRFPAQQGNIIFRTDLPYPPLLGWVDQLRLEQVIDNLVSNAIKYTPNGGEVFVGLRPTREWVTLTVRDTGLGIPEDAIPRLFDAFYRVRRAEHSKIEGTGLGLSIVKAIVDRHGGEIQVESALGQGTEFRVHLPVLSVAEEVGSSEG